MIHLHWPKLRRQPKPQVLAPVPQTPEPPKQELIALEVGKKEFGAQIDDVAKFRAHVMSLPCPLCNTAKLELMAYEKGTDGWEAGVTCNACFVKGVFNDSGFRVVTPINIDVKQAR